MGKTKITVALAGNPNCGKTSVFNQLTGLHQDIGNYPGVTVERKTGTVSFLGYEIEITDLPGTYSLSAYSEDELVARNFILNGRPDVVLNVVDASSLERNLYLTVQLLELEAPLVLAMNMSDVVQHKGLTIDYQKLSQEFGVPVVPTVGHKGHGIAELLQCVVDTYEGKAPRHIVHVDYGPEIFDEVVCLEKILCEYPQIFSGRSLRWTALKILERDPQVMRCVTDSPGRDRLIEQQRKSRDHLKVHFGEAVEIMMADRRYGFISGAVKPARSVVHDQFDASDMADRIILNRVLGLPIFAGVMYLIFKFTFSGSAPLVKGLGRFFEWLAGLAGVYITHDVIRSFLIDGLIHGVGSLLEFVPLIMCMFLAIAVMEDSGYMARAAFLMDKFMTRFGLHGKSFLPLMISTNGCAVLGMLSSRTLENPRDRLITMLITPFMICGAKLPIFAVFIAAFFPPEYSVSMMFLLYLISIVMALAAAWALRRFVFKGDVEHFVMELPPYRVPSIHGVLLKTWERGWVYMKKAGTVILVISVLIWASFSFPLAKSDDPISPAQRLEASFAGRFAKMTEPVLRPLGLDWKAGAALIGGVAAKEVVISTFGTLYSLERTDGIDQSLTEQLRRDPAWNPLKAFVFLIFFLLYAPCCVSAAIFFKESRHGGWTAALMLGTTVLAWAVCFVIYRAGLVLGWGI